MIWAGRAGEKGEDPESEPGDEDGNIKPNLDWPFTKIRIPLIVGRWMSSSKTFIPCFCIFLPERQPDFDFYYSTILDIK